MLPIKMVHSFELKKKNRWHSPLGEADFAEYSFQIGVDQNELNVYQNRILSLLLRCLAMKNK